MAPSVWSRPLLALCACLVFLCISLTTLNSFPQEQSARLLLLPPAETVPELPQDFDTLSRNFAYLQYVTSPASLCSALTVFASLAEAGAVADLLLVYPEEWNKQDEGATADLLRKAMIHYNVKLSPLATQPESSRSSAATRLIAFSQTHYQRILILDVDSLILHAMDELFLLPAAPVAMPYAYWLRNETLDNRNLEFAPQITLLTPSTSNYERYRSAIHERGTVQDHDEIFAQLFFPETLVFEHRPYLMVIEELTDDPTRAAHLRHVPYLGSTSEKWDVYAALDEVKLLHFSDGKLAKPQVPLTPYMKTHFQPSCSHDSSHSGAEDTGECKNSAAWVWAHHSYVRKREAACGESLSGVDNHHHRFHQRSRSMMRRGDMKRSVEKRNARMKNAEVEEIRSFYPHEIVDLGTWGG